MGISLVRAAGVEESERAKRLGVRDFALPSRDTGVGNAWPVVRII